MKILAADTATRSCSVAIADGSALRVEITLDTGQTHSKHLLKMVDSALSLSDLTIRDIDGFAVTSGPGSLTGLRIAMSSIKGLSLAMQKPMVGVSTLEALAMQCTGASPLISPLIDARKGEVYSCRYRFDGDRKLEKVGSEGVHSLDAALEGIREPCLFVGDGARLYKENILIKLGSLANFASPDKQVIRASTVARLAAGRLDAARAADMDGMVPHYIRKSDAEMKLSEANRRCKIRLPDSGSGYD